MIFEIESVLLLNIAVKSKTVSLELIDNNVVNCDFLKQFLFQVLSPLISEPLVRLSMISVTHTFEELV